MKNIVLFFWGIVFILLSPLDFYAQEYLNTIQVQEILKELGYNPGNPDGVMGMNTENALKEFQGDNKITLSGKLDGETKRLLIEHLDELVVQGKVTIPETESVAQTSTRFLNEARISARSGNCFELDFLHDLTDKGQKIFDTTREFGVFSLNSSGTTYTFIGTVCIPEQEFEMTLRDLNFGQPQKTENGKWVAAGPAEITGKALINFEDRSRVFEVSGNTTNPLILLLTPHGYKYMKGSGTVTTPGGKKYSF